MKVRLTLIEDMLGTASANPEIHKEYIASKGPDAKGREEEVAAIGVEASIEKAMTVFPRGADGKPILWDYQVKGFIKEATGILIDLLDGEVKVGKTKLSKFTYKRLVDNFIFVSPRQIAIRGELAPNCTRPLRAETMQGERVALATSEAISAGATIDCEIKCLVQSLEDVVRRCLDFGALKGLGQWRNSGKGRFTWEELK